MVNRIEIKFKISDNRAEVLKKQLQENLAKNKIKSVLLVDVYTLDKNFDNKKLKKIAIMLSNDVSEQTTINKSSLPKNFTWAIEVGFLPGVTDNVAATAKEAIEDLFKIKFKGQENVYTSQIIFIKANISKDEALKITDSLYNPVIQRAKIKSYLEFKKSQGMGIEVPKVKLDRLKKTDKININMGDKELINLGKNGIKNKDGSFRGPLALDLKYLKAIQKYFNKLKRKPTDIELESIAQTWSEHCKHTIFADPMDELKNGLYETYIKAATDKIRKKKGSRDFCVSVFTDNSGAIEFDKDYLITDKVETHNSPSALDPFGGAITGIVGVNRDAIGFGLGAKPIINRYGFCFADPWDKKLLYKGPNFTQKMLTPRRIMDGVIEGVNSGGNCSGISTPQGFLIFDKRYKGKPLVFVGTLGLIPKKINKIKAYLKKAKPGDYIVMVGGRVGLDGIHGATFSSEAMDSGSPATAVQIGDPITQKKLSDALIKEARDLDLYNSITDNGAGGLSCSVAEMAKESNGCKVNLDKVPLKYPGLAPWQIWISESQERMTLAVPKEKWNQFFDLMKRRGVEATIIGKFTNSAKCIVKYLNQTIMNINMDFLHNGLPPRLIKTSYKKKQYLEPKIPILKDLTKTLVLMLKRLNITSFEFISKQYDHEVQGGSVIKPLQGKGRINSEATVVRPILSSQKGVIISQGINPFYSEIDTYHMAACCIDTAIRNVISTGGNLDKIALLDNFCWCSSNEPERLGQLKQAAKACYDYALAFNIPFISGKDSMFNDFKGFDDKARETRISVLPTLLVSSIGIIKDIYNTVSMDIKFPGDLVYILGETFDELGGSEYFRMWKSNYIGNQIPKVYAKKNKKLYQALSKCIQKELIASSISVANGGLAVALAKMAIAGNLGLEISTENLPGKFSRQDFCLYSESQGRILVTIDPENKKIFEKMMKGNSYKLIGIVSNKKTIIIKAKNDEKIVDLNLNLALKAYKSTFSKF